MTISGKIPITNTISHYDYSLNYEHVSGLGRLSTKTVVDYDYVHASHLL